MKQPYVIVGGGIIGCAIAREIRRKDLGDVLVLEKERELGFHASVRNSGVIHSGINQKPGTMKAEMCVVGNRMSREFCKEKKVNYEECGTLVIAKDENERQTLDTIYNWGLEVGVPGLKIINKDELKEREPEIKGKYALFSPTGAIVDSKEFLMNVAEDAKDRGAEFVMCARVKKIESNLVITTAGDFKYRHLINCAGLYSDKISEMCGLKTGLKVIGFRGDYKEVNVSINSMVYQVPDLRFPFLGVHLTKNINGKVLAGPSASLSWRGRESYNGEFDLGEILDIFSSKNFWNMVMNVDFIRLAIDNVKLAISDKVFLREINCLLERRISMEDVQQYRSGIRAQMVDVNGKMINDHLIKRGERSTHILNAVSPGMTSSLAFAEYVVNKFL